VLDGIPIAVLSDVSAWIVTASVSLAIVRLIYKGKLVPYSTLMVYKEALEAERAANAELRAALGEGGRASTTAVTHLFESLRPEHLDGEES
jgi:hypothetical protein